MTAMYITNQAMTILDIIECELCLDQRLCGDGRMGRGNTGFSDVPAAGPAKSAAERMMEKMGWQEGQGLGRTKQGMTTPLVAQKLDSRSGVIINAASRAGQVSCCQSCSRRVSHIRIYQHNPSSLFFKCGKNFQYL